MENNFKLFCDEIGKLEAKSQKPKSENEKNTSEQLE